MIASLTKENAVIDFSALVGHQDMLPAGSPDVAHLRADAAQLLTQVDEREHLHTRKVVPLAAGMWNALYRLEPAGIVAKLSFGDNAFEVNFLRDAAALGVPVPKVYGSGKLEYPRLPNATYFLMDYIADTANGWALAHTSHRMSVEALEQLGHDLGQALVRLHQMHLGYVDRFGVRVETWKDVLTDGFSSDWDDIAPNALFDDQLLPIFKRVLDQTQFLSFQNGTLIHGDLVLTNVLVDADTHRLRAIIDPGGYAGMPMYDLGYAAVPWDHGFAFHNAMIDSYRQLSDKFDPALFYTSILVTAYRFNRFHTPEVKASIYRDILPKLGV